MSIGVLRGAGKQFVGAIANVIAFYGVGLPLAYAICFRLRRGVDGLIIGIAGGSLVQVTVLLVLIVCFQDYLYSSNIVHKDAVFSPLRMDESVHSNDDGLELGRIARRHRQSMQGVDEREVEE